MGFLDRIFQGNTKTRYVQQSLKKTQNGFTEQEAQAMAWICSQKSLSKFYGASTGLFLAFSWGHYHNIILRYLPFSFNVRFTQLGIIMGSILFFDYLGTGRRYGANELFANELQMNNNLFLANVDSLVQNFDIFTRKFTPEEIEAFNFRKNLIKTNHNDLKQKKWIYNPKLYTPEEFQRNVHLSTHAPWENILEYSSKHGKEVVSSPVNIGSLIDETGDRLGIVQKFTFGWSPIH